MTKDDQIELVLEGLAGGQSLRKCCEAVGLQHGNFLRWVAADPELETKYARARAYLLDCRAEELEDIGEQAAEASDAVRVAGLRLQSDNRKWLLSKLAPKKYGDRLSQEISGPDGKPIEHSHSVSSATRGLLEDLSRG